VIDDPKTVSVAPASVLDQFTPAEVAVSWTEVVELTADAANAKYVIGPDVTERSKLARLDVAVPPVSALPLAVSEKRPVARLNGPEVIEKEANPLELL
jgi:hypothetical protein